MFGGDKGKTRRVANLQSDVAALEAAIEAARAEYDRVLERNLKVLPQKELNGLDTLLWNAVHRSGGHGWGSAQNAVVEGMERRCIEAPCIVLHDAAGEKFEGRQTFARDS